MYKIVASYNGGSFVEVDIVKTKQDAEYLVSEYRMAYRVVYGQGWRVIYYNTED